jgi:hypothetical protein
MWSQPPVYRIWPVAKTLGFPSFYSNREKLGIFPGGHNLPLLYASYPLKHRGQAVTFGGAA